MLPCCNVIPNLVGKYRFFLIRYISRYVVGEKRPKGCGGMESGGGKKEKSEKNFSDFLVAGVGLEPTTSGL